MFDLGLEGGERYSQENRRLRWSRKSEWDRYFMQKNVICKNPESYEGLYDGERIKVAKT